jgi:hypothetical protein
MERPLTCFYLLQVMSEQQQNQVGVQVVKPW